MIHQLSVKRTNSLGRDFEFTSQVWPPREILSKYHSKAKLHSSIPSSKTVHTKPAFSTGHTHEEQGTYSFKINLTVYQDSARNSISSCNSHQHNVNQGFIKGGSKISKTIDTFTITECLSQCRTKCESYVLTCVVVIYPRITLCIYQDVEEAMR